MVIVVIIITNTATFLTILYIMHVYVPDIVVDVEYIG